MVTQPTINTSNQGAKFVRLYRSGTICWSAASADGQISPSGDMD